jgi:hypothetical protein
MIVIGGMGIPSVVSAKATACLAVRISKAKGPRPGVRILDTLVQPNLRNVRVHLWHVLYFEIEELV